MTSISDEFDELLHRGYRYSLSLTHNSEMAQDILQEACLKISRRGGPWNVRYLVTTIRNTYIDQYRRASKLHFIPLDDADLVDDIDITLHLVDPQLELALAQLRDEERELLYLSAVEGYSASEIAKHTKRPRGTILSALHRAKKKLQKLLIEYVSE
ncbi:MAG: RNA polymerase sigma factor [Chloroflexota bacterium]